MSGPTRGRAALLVIGDQHECDRLRRLLESAGLTVLVETSVSAGLERLERLSDPIIDVLIVDLDLGLDALDLCRWASTERPELPVVVVTGNVSIDSAVAAFRMGAYDFFTKPIDTKLLNPVMARAVRHHRLWREVSRLRKALGDSQRFGKMIGRSTVMLEVFDLIERVAHSEASVLVTGESGTGKDLVARWLHARSRRSAGPFMALNCAALPPGLVESELFGHARGAFTGANEARDGLFVKATGGTLFLDKIGDLPSDVQAKLLRALQERRVRPVGGTQERMFDIRLVTATNRDLTTDVESGHFRADLLYRIDVVRVELPPLRLRGRDVLLLAQAFIERYAAQCQQEIQGLDPAAAELLLGYDWPGNVRELENCIERAVALAHGDRIGASDLPSRIHERQAKPVVLKPVVLKIVDPEDLPTLDQLEHRHIQRVLDKKNKTKKNKAKKNKTKKRFH